MMQPITEPATAVQTRDALGVLADAGVVGGLLDHWRGAQAAASWRCE